MSYSGIFIAFIAHQHILKRDIDMGFCQTLCLSVQNEADMKHVIQGW